MDLLELPEPIDDARDLWAPVLDLCMMLIYRNRQGILAGELTMKGSEAQNTDRHQGKKEPEGWKGERLASSSVTPMCAILAIDFTSGGSTLDELHRTEERAEAEEDGRRRAALGRAARNDMSSKSETGNEI